MGSYTGADMTRDLVPMCMSGGYQRPKIPVAVGSSTTLQSLPDLSMLDFFFIGAISSQKFKSPSLEILANCARKLLMFRQPFLLSKLQSTARVLLPICLYCLGVNREHFEQLL